MNRTRAVKAQRARSNDKPSRLYDEVVRILRRLEAEEGEADTAFAEAMSDIWRERETMGLHRSSGIPHPPRLLGKHPLLLKVQPWLDHVAVWNKNGRPAVFTSQPYGLCWEALCGLVDFCRQNGLEAGLTPRVPGTTRALRSSSPLSGPAARALRL